MTKTFLMKLDAIQPSQLYISSKKLDIITKSFPSKLISIEPIPIKKLGDRIVFVDGHTRAFAAFLRGFSEVPVYWEYEEEDWEAYEICVKWCKEEGTHTIADLMDKVISHQEYEKLWLGRCAKMQKDLEQRRKQLLKQPYCTE
ncbi:hypothetical protein KAS06_03750 [Candidatus Bathyarchaeota archaeon]|nr:hypothetical protein [Candidatus Bathyarchaeota archaeon]